MAVKVGKDEKASGLCGTPSYVAPEVITDKSYDHRVDIWSLGTLLYLMLSGEQAFPLYDDRKNTFKEIVKGNYNFKDEIWEYVSNEAKDLIRSML